VVPFNDVVWLATTLEQWQTALAAALEPEANSSEAANARRVRAKQHDWDFLVGQIAAQLRSRLDTVRRAAPVTA
jgi:hypothetical protein